MQRPEAADVLEQRLSFLWTVWGPVSDTRQIVARPRRRTKGGRSPRYLRANPDPVVSVASPSTMAE